MNASDEKIRRAWKLALAHDEFSRDVALNYSADCDAHGRRILDDDLFQEARMAMFKAALDYDFSVGDGCFSLYAHPLVINAVRKVFLRELRHGEVFDEALVRELLPESNGASHTDVA